MEVSTNYLVYILLKKDITGSSKSTINPIGLSNNCVNYTDENELKLVMRKVIPLIISIK